MKTVAILHGWAGGWMHVREFCKTLDDASFKVIKNPRKADIIIAHSTGCYRMPENSNAQLVLVLGPPYWPGKSILKRLIYKKGHDTRLHIKQRGLIASINKHIWEIIYIVIKPSYTFIALKNHRNLHFLDLLENKEVILIRNEEDYFCSPEIKEAVKKYKNARYVQLPGGHDDFMTNPTPYIDLVLKEL